MSPSIPCKTSQLVSQGVLNLTFKLGPPLWHFDRLHVMPADFGPRLPPEGVEGVLVVSLNPSHPPHCVEANTFRRFWNMVLSTRGQISC